MKKRKLLSVVLTILLSCSILSVFAGSNSFWEPLGSVYWSGSVDVTYATVSADTSLDPLPPIVNLYAGVSLTAYYIDFEDNLYFDEVGTYEDYVDYIGIFGQLKYGYKQFVAAYSSHRGYINGNEAFQYLNALQY